VVIPTECEYFSLRGLALLTDTVDKVRDRLNPKLEISGILLTRYDRAPLTRVRSWPASWSGSVTSVRHRDHRTVRFPETSVAASPSLRGRPNREARWPTARWPASSSTDSAREPQKDGEAAQRNGSRLVFKSG